MSQREYDARYRETGSSNISKATPEWAEKLDQAAAMQATGDERYLIHIATALVNDEALAGVPWAKCMNCGSPFRVVLPWVDATLCSEACGQEYLNYLDTMR